MTEPIGPTKVVTFYSYKGGVGRTMALVNTAHVLALEGWRVLMVDFDLEAPGMTHFFAKEVRQRPSYVHKDSLELLLDAKRSLETADEKGQQPHYPQSLAEYVVPLSLPKAWVEEAPGGIPYRNGRLDLIPATLEPLRSENPSEGGTNLDYMERLGELDLAGLFQQGGPGHRFGDHVRKQFVNARFEAPGDILFSLRDPVNAAYDFVFIDSRTGLNEIAGFSIGAVADVLVICCGLNQQNIEGTRYFMKKTGLFDRRRAKPFVVAVGPIPPWQTLEVESRLNFLRQALHLFQDTNQPFGKILDAGPVEGSLAIAYEYPEFVEIPYHPQAALRELVFVTEMPNDPIAHAYMALARRIRSKVSPGALEAAQQRMDFLHLVHNPDAETLLKHCRRAASQLPELRMLRGRAAPIPLFPTAIGLTSIPQRDNLWEYLGFLPVAAAVSALHLDRSAPFERAWSFLQGLRFGTEKSFLARCLVYFQASFPCDLPEDVEKWLVVKSGEDPVDEMQVVSDVCACVAALKLASYSQTFVAGVDKRAFMREALPLRIVSGSLSRWHPVKIAYSSAEALSLLVESVENLVSGTLNEDRGLPEFINEFYQLPGHPMEILQGAVDSKVLSTLDSQYVGSAYAKTPVGFWPEPLAATAAAVSKGSDAIQEILAWLYLARLRYGYAWRVLLDWRYFDDIKKHPDFQSFVRQEDKVVEEIEGMIDRGEFPL